MTVRTASESLLWVTRRYAINLTSISTIFRATNGQIEISFINGQPLTFPEKDLTPEAAAVLLPDVDNAHLHLEQTR